MAEKSAISWTDGTYNAWIGCTKISPACDICYAERDNARRKWVPGWGQGEPRRQTKTAGDMRRLNRDAGLTGARPRIFCNSLSDILDNEVPQEWREALFDLWRECTNIRWIPLTKRIGNAAKMLPPDWPFPHVGIMATIINQPEWDRDYRKLVDVPAPWRGISAEPLLGDIVMHGANARDLQWMITGGESGRGFRPLNMNAVRHVRDQCAALGVTFHHKQNGGVRGKDTGCLVDGVEHKHFPPALAA